MAARKPAVVAPTVLTVALSKDKETKNMVRYSTDESVVLPTLYIGKEAFGDADNTSFPESVEVQITF